jgi:hypothetical protein
MPSRSKGPCAWRVVLPFRNPAEAAPHECGLDTNEAVSIRRPQNHARVAGERPLGTPAQRHDRPRSPLEGPVRFRSGPLVCKHLRFKCKALELPRTLHRAVLLNVLASL